MRCWMSRVTCLSLIFPCALSVLAAETTLVDILREKGVLTAEEAGRVEPAASAPVYPQINVGGRIMVDLAGYDSDDADFSNGTELRRARAFIKGRLTPEWFYKLQYDFNGEGADGFQDVYFGYDGWCENVSLRVGQMIEAGSLEDTMSSKYITFMERALPVLAFSPATRRIGVRADTHGAAWHAAAGIFGDTATDDESEDDGVGASARASCALFNEPGRVLHVGASGQYRGPRGETVRFRARPEAHVDDTRLVDTGIMSNVTAYATAGLEAAWVKGALSVQGEYIGVSVDRDNADSVWLDGFYVYASWMLTGESRPYDVTSGEFGRLKPAKPIGEGGIGAWELALRYSELDLDDEVRGGTERNITAGVNWYVNKYTRFMVNYGRADAETDAGDVAVDIAQMRAQIDF